MIENGFVNKWHATFYPQDTCSSKKSNTFIGPATLPNVQGAFVVFVGGLALGIIALMIEFIVCYFRKARAKHNNDCMKSDISVSE